MSLANQFSYLIFSVVGIVVVIGLIRQLFHPRWPVLAGSGVGLAIVAVGLFLLLRPGLSDVDSLADAEAVLANGRPTLVEFFSNYCIGCMGVRPTVDALVSDLRQTYADGVNVLRVDIHTDFGRDLRERYGFSFTPEFVLFDTTGAEVWRSHVPPSLVEIDRLLPERG